jgi:pilus assembly protein Flp/PilA
MTGLARKGGFVTKSDQAFSLARGQGLLEYALAIVLVAIIVVIVVALLGGSTGNLFSNIVSNV